MLEEVPDERVPHLVEGGDPALFLAHHARLLLGAGDHAHDPLLELFLADLARAIEVDNTFDFVAVSSYGKGKVTTGAVKLIKDLDVPIEGKHVIVVEDILDTGLTLSYLRKLLLQHKPASLKIATCLDKPERRLVPIEADYVCFKIPNQFVIGYGMDYAERYRNVADIRLFPDNAGH